jgi:hypothetical protein
VVEAKANRRSGGPSAEPGASEVLHSEPDRFILGQTHQLGETHTTIAAEIKRLNIEIISWKRFRAMTESAAAAKATARGPDR